MKKIAVFLGAAGLAAANSSPLLAGGIDNKHNWSAEYIRTLNRNAATDSADIVAYNPAGIMKMVNGAYANVSVQGVFKTYGNKVDGVDYESDVPSYVPGLFAIYKQDKWAAFFGYTVPAGGGKVEFENGNASTKKAGFSIINAINRSRGLILYDPNVVKNDRVDAESYYHGFTVGGAYAINKMLSLSLNGRYIDANGEATATLQIQPTARGTMAGLTDMTSILDYEETAHGWGGIIGLDIAPTDKMLIGVRYETATPLDFQYKVKRDTGGGIGSARRIIDGVKHRRDLPAILALGLSHQCTPEFRVETDLTYYFNKDATWNTWDTTLNQYVNKAKNANNGYDIGIAFDYRFNEKIMASLGYMYTYVGIAPQDILAEAPQLEASTVGAGFVYTPKAGLDLNVSVGKVFYHDDSYTDTSSGRPLNIEYYKDVIFLAMGIQYKLL